MKVWPYEMSPNRGTPDIVAKGPRIGILADSLVHVRSNKSLFEVSMKKWIGSLPRLPILIILAYAATTSAQTPVLFFTDLDSAPKSGGETVSGYSGAYVTLYGDFFGSSPRVTLNHANCVRIVSGPTTWRWYKKLTIQLGSSCTSGSLVLKAGGQSSNSMPFTVATGRIYFVSSSGKDSNDGSSSSPWKTIPHAVQTAGVAAGNIIYVEDGVSQTADDGQGWDAALTLRQEWCKGTPSHKDALVAYPGATVRIGPSSASSPSYGLRSTDFTASGGACKGSWTFAGVNFRGVNPTGLAGGDTWHYVANDVSNPQARSASSGAAFETSQATHVRVLGSYFHDLNVGDTDRLQQGVYFSTDSNHAELGWSEIYNVYGRAGLQIHSSPIATGTGYAMYDLLIHDNLIHHIREEGIIVDTVDPSKGPVQVYNNVVYNTGFDGAGTALYRAVSSDFNTSHGVGTGTIDWFNNTVYCQGGTGCWSSSFEVHQGQALIDRVRNNVLYAVSGNPYWTPSVSTNNWICPSNAMPSQCPNFKGSNNLVYDDGAPTYTAILSNNVNKNPLFVALGKNFQLRSGSPAIGAGTSSSPAARSDMTGLLRPAVPSIGAYQR